jgi:hypothetical protein
MNRDDIVAVHLHTSTFNFDVNKAPVYNYIKLWPTSFWTIICQQGTRKCHLVETQEVQDFRVLYMCTVRMKTDVQNQESMT